MDPPLIEGNDPIILAGALLRLKEVHLLPAGKNVPHRMLGVANVELHGAFGSYGVLRKVAGSKPEDYWKTLYSKCAEIPTWIGSCQFEDPFDDVLEMFSITKFGGARVTKSGEETLVTLSDAVGLISSGKLSTHMSTDDVSSIPIAISEKRPIVDAIKKMISHSIRRLFVEKGQGKFISDRTLIDYLFSHERLEAARDRPETWLDGELSEVATKFPGMCKTGDLDEAAMMMGSAPDDCLMTDEYRVVSRWDLVVKPWRAGNLATVEA